MEEILYKHLKKVIVDTIKRSDAIWLFDFQKHEQTLLARNKIEKVFIEGELCYKIL